MGLRPGDVNVSVSGMIIAGRVFFNMNKFLPTALKCCRVLFSPMVSGWAAGKSLSGLYLRNHKV